MRHDISFDILCGSVAPYVGAVHHSWVHNGNPGCDAATCGPLRTAVARVAISVGIQLAQQGSPEPEDVAIRRAVVQVGAAVIAEQLHNELAAVVHTTTRAELQGLQPCPGPSAKDSPVCTVCGDVYNRALNDLAVRSLAPEFCPRIHLRQSVRDAIRSVKAANGACSRPERDAQASWICAILTDRERMLLTAMLYFVGSGDAPGPNGWPFGRFAARHNTGADSIRAEIHTLIDTLHARKPRWVSVRLDGPLREKMNWHAPDVAGYREPHTTGDPFDPVDSALDIELILRDLHCGLSSPSRVHLRRIVTRRHGAAAAQRVLADRVLVAWLLSTPPPSATSAA